MRSYIAKKREKKSVTFVTVQQNLIMLIVTKQPQKNNAGTEVSLYRI